MTKICFSRGRCEWHKPNHNSKIIHKISFLARSLQQDICETYIVLLGKISTFFMRKICKKIPCFNYKNMHVRTINCVMNFRAELQN